MTGKVAARLAIAAIGAFGALAGGPALSVHAQYPITGVSVSVSCSISGDSAQCTATVIVQDSNNKPVQGATARFSAAFTGSNGQAEPGPSNSSCGGMNPCSTTTDANGQATSAVTTTICDSTLTVTATVTNPSDGSTKSAQGQATLPACGGVAGLQTQRGGLPNTGTARPGDEHRLGEVLLAGGGLLGLTGAGALALRRRRAG